MSVKDYCNYSDNPICKHIQKCPNCIKKHCKIWSKVALAKTDLQNQKLAFEKEITDLKLEVGKWREKCYEAWSTEEQLRSEILDLEIRRNLTQRVLTNILESAQ